MKMRFKFQDGVNGCTLITGGGVGFKSALHFLRQQKKHHRATLIYFGLRPNTGPMGLAGGRGNNHLERVIFIGGGPPHDGFFEKKTEQLFFENAAQFLAADPSPHFHDETILLVGKDTDALGMVALRLAKKQHSTSLTVDLDALKNNLEVYRAFLRPSTKMMVMVKANAYGGGSVPVSQFLENQDVDYLCVAYADEGVELRQAGVGCPIAVLNPDGASFENMLKYNLEPEIHSPGLWHKFTAFCEAARPARPVNVHLKLDTGMHRLGFAKNEIDDLLESRFTHHGSRIHIKSIFSHLAGSDDPAHDDFTRRQVAEFNAMYERLANALGHRPMRHILNSTGIVRFPEFQMDMVRLGLGIYGVDGSGLIQEKLQIVNSLTARISQVKKIAEGETVGYGRMGKAGHDMRIATVNVGYADGFLRKAGNGRYSLLIRGQRAPLVGNVCMDMVMVDVSHIPEAQPSDEVLLFGKNENGEVLPVQELAACLGTIPYEVFTGISLRVKRVYVESL